MTRTVRVDGHFGEWVEGRLRPDGPVVLVTLPCPVLAVTVCWHPAQHLSIGGDAAPLLPCMRASRLLDTLGLEPRGAIEVSADMPAGGGAGASTAALIALARAVAGRRLAAGALAAACLAAEGATDPLMLARPDAHLWASRAARTLGRLPMPPAFDVVGGYFGPPVRTDPADTRLPDVADLVDLWRVAARRGDLRGLARIASRSAARTTRFRGPPDDPTPGLAAACGALGHVRAHTGSARGLLFAPGTAPSAVEARFADAGYAGVFRFRTR